VIDLVKEYNASGRRPDQIALLLDTKGPEVRSGDLATAMMLKTGDQFVFTIDRTTPIDPSEKKTTVNYDDFVNDVQVDDVLLVDGGLQSMQVLHLARRYVTSTRRYFTSHRRYFTFVVHSRHPGRVRTLLAHKVISTRNIISLAHPKTRSRGHKCRTWPRGTGSQRGH
jgi:hypothetical protein